MNLLRLQRGSIAQIFAIMILTGLCSGSFAATSKVSKKQAKSIAPAVESKHVSPPEPPIDTLTFDPAHEAAIQDSFKDLRELKEQRSKVQTASLRDKLVFLQKQTEISKSGSGSWSDLYLQWFTETSGMLPAGGPDPRTYLECIDRDYHVMTELGCETLVDPGETEKYVALNLKVVDDFLSWAEKKLAWKYIGDAKGVGFITHIADNGEGKDCAEIRMRNFNAYPVLVSYSFTVKFESGATQVLDQPTENKYGPVSSYLVLANDMLPDSRTIVDLDKYEFAKAKPPVPGMAVTSMQSCFSVRQNGHMRDIGVTKIVVKPW